MEPVPLSRQIEDLQGLIEMQEENYRYALLKRTGFNQLKEMRLHIRQLKEDLLVLIMKNSLNVIP